MRTNSLLLATSLLLASGASAGASPQRQRERARELVQRTGRSLESRALAAGLDPLSTKSAIGSALRHVDDASSVRVRQRGNVTRITGDHASITVAHRSNGDPELRVTHRVALANQHESEIYGKRVRMPSDPTGFGQHSDMLVVNEAEGSGRTSARHVARARDQRLDRGLILRNETRVRTGGERPGVWTFDTVFRPGGDSAQGHERPSNEPPLHVR